jgi:predicted TIM-barrel fold metal-dependent hydrolase
MLFNAHVHMSQWGRDFTPELAEVHLAQFRGRNSWITGQPWTPDGWCMSGADLISHMDAAGVDRALVMCLAYVPVGAYDPTMGDYIADLVATYPDRLVGFYSANPLGGAEEAARLRHYVTERGLSGLKMLPSYNYAATGASGRCTKPPRSSACR